MTFRFVLMKPHFSFLLLASILFLAGSLAAQDLNYQALSYRGQWKGKNVVVTLKWSNYLGESTVTGTIYDRATRRTHEIEGQSPHSGFLEFGFDDDNYKMSPEIKDGHVVWSGGPGNSLTFSRPNENPKWVDTGGGGGLHPQPPPPPVQPREITSNPIAWPVGKWPEGMAYDGQYLWVAESGQRTLAQLDINTGQIIRRVTSGRLPTSMAAHLPSQTVYSIVATDKKVIRYSQSGQGGNFTGLAEYPNDMATDDTAIYVLEWIGGSNASAQVVRYDMQSGASRKSDVLPQGANKIRSYGDRVFVSLGFGEQTGIAVMNSADLSPVTGIKLPGFTSNLAVNGHAIFVAGGKWGEYGEIARVDATLNWQETARHQIPGEFIYQLTATEEFVIAVGVQGTVRVYDAESLNLLVTSRLNWGSGDFMPSSLLVEGSALYIATHQGNGDNGTILKLPNFVPQPVPVP